jgi:hydroxylamine reductase
LGIKDIYLGPKPPQFVNDDIFAFLQQNFNLHLTETKNYENDLKNLLITA